MTDISQKQNFYWIDSVKGLCMLCVYWMHSEAYCPIVSQFSISSVVSPFYVNAFFIVSGFLFFYTLVENEQDYAARCWKKGENVIFRLLIPTVLFSSLNFVPKCIFHMKEISLPVFCFNILGGISFWFTSALVITQFVMIFLCLVFKKKIWVSYLVLCLITDFSMDEKLFSISGSMVLEKRFGWVFSIFDRWIVLSL